MQFQQDIVTANYRTTEHNFKFYYRNLWDWALDLAGNPQLAPHFEWDAQRLFKFDGEQFIQFYHEPWTGNRWWKAQVCFFQSLLKCDLTFEH